MLTKDADLDKYKYSDYRIWFDSHSEFLFTDRRMRKKAIVFGADVSSSVQLDHKGKDI